MKTRSRLRRLRKTRLRTRKQRGGIVNRLHVTPEQVKNDWSLFYLAAHGGAYPLIPRNVNNPVINRIPENTYVLFIAPSGYICSENEDAILNLITTTTLGEKDMYRFYNYMANLMNGGNDRVPFFTNPVANLNRVNLAGEKIGIYEPGDEYPDLRLSFQTPFPVFFETGLYSLPMESKMMTKVEELQDEIKEFVEEKARTERLAKMYGESEREKILRRLGPKETYLKGQALERSSAFANRRDNLLKDRLKEKRPILLSELLEEDRAPGRQKLYIVYACRVPIIHNDENQIARFRRLSVGQHRVAPTAPAATPPSAAAAPAPAVDAPVAAPPKVKAAYAGLHGLAGAFL